MRAESPDIRLINGFLPEHASLFRRLLGECDWDGRRDEKNGRKVASFGIAYDYRNMGAFPAVPMHPALVPICDAIHEEFGFRPNNCLVNLYADDTSGIQFHSDGVHRLMPDTGSAIVSLGAERMMLFRRVEGGGITHSYRLTAGSLLFIPIHVHHSWMHAVPPEPGAGTRISLLFTVGKSA